MIDYEAALKQFLSYGWVKESELVGLDRERLMSEVIEPIVNVALCDVTCRHADEEVREMAYQVWLKDQTKLVERALSEEALDAFAKERECS